MPGKSVDLTYILQGKDQSASETMTHTAHVAESVSSRIGGAFMKVGGVLGGEFGEILNRVGEGVSQVGEHAGRMKTSFIVGGAAATGLGLALQNLSSGDKQAQDQLKNAIENSGASWDEYEHRVESAVSTQENFGHGAADTQQALQKMTTAFGDPKKALADLSVAANLAASKHISLADASDLVVRIVAGKGAKTLSQYGIVMAANTGSAHALTTAQNNVAKASGTLATAQHNLKMVHEALSGKTKITAADHVKLENAQYKVHQASQKLTQAQNNLRAAHTGAATGANRGQKALEELSGKIDGQAKASVNNFSAQWGILTTKMTDWAADAGRVAGPVITAIGPALSLAGVAMDLFQKRQLAAGAAAVASAAAQDTAAAATDVATGSTWAFNTALLANPITWIVLAIVALIAIIILLATHWKQVTEFLGTAWKNVLSFFKTVGAAISKWWNDFWGGIFGWAVNLFKNFIRLEVAGFTALWQGLVAIGKNISNWWNGLWSGLAGFIGTVFKGVSNWLVDVLFNPLITQLDNIIAGINMALSGAKIVSGGAINLHINPIPHLPHLAMGGIVSSPTVALIGEAGPEAVVPLSRGRGFGGGTVINIQVSGSVHADKVGAAKFFVDAITYAAKSGQIPRGALSTALQGV